MSDRNDARWVQAQTGLSYEAVLEGVRATRGHVARYAQALEISDEDAILRLSVDHVHGRRAKLAMHACSACGAPFYTERVLVRPELGPECRGFVHFPPDNAELLLWARRQMRRDHLTSGRVPGFEVVDRGQPLSALGRHEAGFRLSSSDAARFGDLEHFLDYSTEGPCALVTRTAEMMLASAVSDEPNVIMVRWTFDAVRSVMPPPSALIFPWWVASSGSLPALPVRTFASAGVPDDQVLAISGPGGRYILNSTTAVTQSGPEAVLHVPAQAWLVGRDRAKLRRFTILEARSLAQDQERRTAS